MTKINGDSGAPNDELSVGLSRWLTVGGEVDTTLNELARLDDSCPAAIQFISELRSRVQIWMAWELWASLLDREHYSPDELLRSLIYRPSDGADLGGADDE